MELAARLGFALGSQVQSMSSFDRKHYHYPDLPHGYQITQQRSPIALGGQIEVFVDTKEGGTKDDSKGKNHTAEQTPRTLRVERLQLEMDTGKRTGSSRGTLVDLNRAGSTLVEIVTAPDLRGAEEAAAAAETFQQIVRFLGVGDADMEAGELRVDVNVSHRRVDGSVVGDRCEVKNLNSFRSIARAIRHERTRQIALMRSGAVVPRQTRSFDPIAGTTKVLRDKEALLDYRFAPEPDLPHVVLEPATLEMIRSAVPELPSRARVRLMDQYGLTSALAARVASHKSSVAYFDECVSSANTRANENGVMPPGAADVANWVTGTLVGAAKKANVAGHKEPLLGLPESADADRVGTLLASIGGAKNGGFTLTARMAKSVLAAMLSGDTRPVPEISKELFYSGDEGASVEAGGEGEGRALAATCADVVGSMPDQVELLRGGKTRLMGLFVGEVMKRTKGRADPRRAAEIIKSLVDQ